MKKILAVFDPLKMSESTLNYSIQLAQSTGAYLVGVFPEEFQYREALSGKPITPGPGHTKKREAAIRKFQSSCGKSGIQYSVHQSTGIAILELKHESIFSDLLVIEEHETFHNTKEYAPTRFIRDLLTDVQCPVVVVPKTYRAIDKIVLLYDGRPSSVYAIRMFSYLFGTMNGLQVDVLAVKENNSTTLHLPDNMLMREFLKRHYPKAKVTITKGDAEEHITAFLRNHRENELVVLGAYRRSSISRFFKTSMADILMKETNCPLFIAHH